MSRDAAIEEKQLILNFFTIYLGANNPPLNHTRFWVESIGHFFTSINSYATHLQQDFKFENRNFKSVEIGGGTFLKRILAIFRLLRIAQKIVTSKHKNVCLFHMTTKSALVLAPILRLFRIPMFLWYSHQAKPMSLRLILPLMTSVFSPTKNSFPIKTSKLLATGHGLVLSHGGEGSRVIDSRDKRTILVIGRVARVKRIENLIVATSRGPRLDWTIESIGPAEDAQYLAYLKELSRRSKIEFRHLKSMESDTLASYMAKKNLVFSGTQGSVDKAPLEAVANGCLLVSPNQDLQIISGMSELWWKEFGVNGGDLSIERQLTLLAQSELSLDKRNELLKKCRSKNNLLNLSKTISTLIMKYI